jgi:hypothetical protein
MQEAFFGPFVVILQNSVEGEETQMPQSQGPC